MAALHAAGISHGFLPSLGTPFLIELYTAMDADPRSTIFVARDPSGQIVGFVSGGIGMDSIFPHMFRRWPAVLRALAPIVLSPRKIARIAELLWFGRLREPERPWPKAELYSIVVAESDRGTGVARSLYNALISYFAERGVADFRIVVGEALTSAHQFYRKMGAVPVARITVHRGSASIVYRQDVSPYLAVHTR